MTPADPLLLQTDTGWLAYEQPLEVLATHERDQIPPLLARLESAAAEGLTAVGFLTYEAAACFDPALITHVPGPLPLAWFSIFERARPISLDSLGPRGGYRLGEWAPSLEPGPYAGAVSEIHQWIARGDTYQVNFTLRLDAHFEGDALAWFRNLAERGGSRHGAFIDTGRHTLCSLSPELFFDLEGDLLTARPMKGTARRGRTTEEDEDRAARLRESIKDRAENVMIVDMVRNDLGRVARPGTVEASRLWEVERYPTLFQLTSTCRARSDAPVPDILGALFPSASITGAPKVRTMEIIHALEARPRGIYTGAIGTIGPGRRARFNVAIRTVAIDRETRRAEYGTGGGIVWDSQAEDEYRECSTKALVVTDVAPPFDLLETLRWEPARGFLLLDRHLDRLSDSADYFDRPCDLERVRRHLADAVRGSISPLRLRLTLDALGTPTVETYPLCEEATRPWNLALASEPVDRHDPFLFHKTTARHLYQRAREDNPGFDDVLLWNREGELTESTLANVVVRRGGGLVTPPIDCGVLPGTLRAHLLSRGRVHEAQVHREELHSIEELFLVNSVRGWVRARVETVETLPHETP